MRFKKKYGGGGGTTTSENIPAWARPYIERAAQSAEAQYSAGNLDNVAGPTASQQLAFTGGASAIAKAGGVGLDTLQDQQTRLQQMAATGGAEELQDALALDIGMGEAGVRNQFGATGTLGSSRNALASATSADAAKAKYAQQVINNKMTAEGALGQSVSGSSSLAGKTASDLAQLGNQERSINQQLMDKDWQALQRYASTIYGSPARQQAVSEGGK